MPFSTSATDHAYVLTPEGRFLGSLERDRWNANITYLRACGYRYLVIDCSGVTFMDSVGIGLLAGATRRMREGGGDACLAAVPDRLGRVLMMLRLTGSVIPTFGTIAEALREAEAVSASAPDESVLNPVGECG